ncbi:arylsulfatase [Lewinella sp. IMCC34183]|uniref:arylsulfatase n=1 Tax=Lewinella sp. IMCC34183 TaxID=2248762 RepID=UPI000E228802|nr:arylsulfatase [Lewinella sp. IMCC34183]
MQPYPTPSAGVSLACFLSLLLLAGCGRSPGTGVTADGTPAPDDRPNIVVIMADDLGYSDIGCYGGEINTPNIDALAADGIRMTQFYNNARCCPTRASLLTGLYAHQVGLQTNGPSMNFNCVTAAEALEADGYQTGMSGKWHLTHAEPLPDPQEHLQWLANQNGPEVYGDLETYPNHRGFDEFYGIVWGVVNYFNPFSLVHNDAPLRDSIGEDFYMTDFITDKAELLIDQFSEKEEPFFLYVAHTAPHWPLHALPEDIAKYKGRYDAGWGALREERYARMVEMGLIDSSVSPDGGNESDRQWPDVEDQNWESEHMEVHAAMVDHLDAGVGRLIDKLKATGEYENTVIIFLADNGASPERMYDPGYDRPAFTHDGTPIEYTDDHYEHPGPETTMAGIGQAWAGAANTPFRFWKAWSYHGGNATPMIVHWSAGLEAEAGSLVRAPGHVIDLMPTFLDLAGTEYPMDYADRDIPALEGKSLLPLIKGQRREPHEVLFWQHDRGKAVRVGDWKLVRWADQPWELYDLSKDLTETNDLAAEYPEKVEELRARWQEKAEAVGYVDLGGRSMSE